MARVCDYSGKRTTSGQNVSHSQRKTKRTFKPNLFWKKMLDPETGDFFYARLSAKAIKTLTKNPTKMLGFARKMRKKAFNNEKRVVNKMIKQMES